MVSGSGARAVALWALLFWAADTLSKLAIMAEWGLGMAVGCPPGGFCPHPPVDVAAPYLRFIMAWNAGINFGLFDGDSPHPAQRWLLALFAVGVSIFVWRYAARRVDRWSWFGAGLLIGGALGNAYDRIAYGYVVDFLNMSCCGYSNPYVFNLADVFIFAGMGVLILRADGSGASSSRRE